MHSPSNWHVFASMSLHNEKKNTEHSQQRTAKVFVQAILGNRANVLLALCLLSGVLCQHDVDTFYVHGLEYLPDTLHEVLCVNFDVHKDVHAWDLSDINWHQAAVPIMHQKVCSQSCRTEVIDTACSIGHITQNEAVLNICKTDSNCKSAATSSNLFCRSEAKD